MCSSFPLRNSGRSRFLMFLLCMAPNRASTLIWTNRTYYSLPTPPLNLDARFVKSSTSLERLVPRLSPRHIEIQSWRCSSSYSSYGTKIRWVEVPMPVSCRPCYPHQICCYFSSPLLDATPNSQQSHLLQTPPIAKSFPLGRHSLGQNVDSHRLGHFNIPNPGRWA